MTTSHSTHPHPVQRHVRRRRTLRRTVYHMLGGEGHSDLLVSGFSEQMRIRREEYREALEDGSINRSEHRLLERTRRTPQRSGEEASLILRPSVETGHPCPHCAKPLRGPHSHSGED